MSETFSASVKGVSRPLMVICAQVVSSGAFANCSNDFAQPTESRIGSVKKLMMSL